MLPAEVSLLSSSPPSNLLGAGAISVFNLPVVGYSGFTSSALYVNVSLVGSAPLTLTPTFTAGAGTAFVASLTYTIIIGSGISQSQQTFTVTLARLRLPTASTFPHSMPHLDTVACNQSVSQSVA